MTKDKGQRTKKYLSVALIAGGLILFGAGIAMPLKDQLVLRANRPPTASSDSRTQSLSDNPLLALDAPAEASPTPTLTPAPTLTPTPTNTFTPAETQTPRPSAAPTLTPTATPTPTANPYPPAQLPPTRIVAKSIGLDSPVVEAGWHQETVNGKTISVWDVVEYAAGWHKNSALPGHQGNVVLSGHHNILGEVFRYVVDLEPGDEITLYADDRPYNYVVTEKFILKDKGEPPEARKANGRWIGQFDDQRLTLVTCWPYTNNTHRVVVIAKPKQ